ncbi:hypothetical protein PanWU01x14_049510 [Parasponia andersonii]|uniref:Uncharacterized protein n=1 Tax=Parasponia andersonii TaxID=3476 RepID=A0A2P5DMP3_PARAD|nr:hypothetical protein PanWU01x14_049510 [Parasponia andersonii]
MENKENDDNDHEDQEEWLDKEIRRLSDCILEDQEVEMEMGLHNYGVREELERGNWANFIDDDHDIIYRLSSSHAELSDEESYWQSCSSSAVNSSLFHGEGDVEWGDQMLSLWQQPN